jgi:MinD-like ATPase involved in chromosome partitioning or flagellar assembly/ABC-type transporter Mla subunit MlaD
VRPLLKISNSGHHPESNTTIGKLIVFAGLEAGAGKALCAASIATRLARRWRCLAIELDNRGNLQSYLSPKPAERKVLASFEDLADSLEPLKTKTGVPNLDFIGWPGGFPKVDRFLGSLRSDPADYVFATLSPGTSDEALAVLRAADVAAIVTHPGHSVDKVFEFLRRLASHGSMDGEICILLNQVRRGGEERETAALLERARADLGLKVSILGTVVYDPQTAAGFLHGASLAAFEDIALKIERLLPRTANLATTQEHAGNGRKRGGGMFAAVLSPFGRKRRQFEEKLRQRDQTIATLQRRHESMVDDLQEMLRLKNEDIAEKATLIDGLEDDVRRYTQQLLEQGKRIAELDATVAARQGELERSLKQVHQFEQTNGVLAREKAGLIHENEIASIQLAERAASVTALEGTIADLRRQMELFQEEKAAEFLERKNRIENLEGIINSQRGEFQKLQESNSILAAEKAEREEAVRGLTEQLSGKENCIADLENRVGSQQVDLQQLHNQIRRLEESSSVLVAENADREEAARILAEQLSEKGNCVAELQNRADVQLADLQQLRDQIRQLQESNGVLAAEKADREQTVRSQRADLEQLQDRIRELREWNGLLEDQKIELHHEKDSLEFERDEIACRLTEAEALIRERNIVIESKDAVIGELGDRLGELSSGHEALVARTAEALQHLYSELRLHREHSQTTLEKWHGLVTGLEACTNALAAQASDTVSQKDAVIRQIEETYRRELSGLHKLHTEKDTAILRLEKVLRTVEEDNQNLKFDFMALFESTTARPGPDVLIREREALVHLLRVEPAESATVIAIDAERDSLDFGIELRSILESAGWNVKFMTSSFESGKFYGLHLVKDSSDIADSAARILSGALEKVGVPFIRRTAPTPGNLSPLRLIIGQSNWMASAKNR